jgi:predicted alpha/beta superfamily hydrolase
MLPTVFLKKSLLTALVLAGLLLFANLESASAQTVKISSVTHERHIIKSKVLDEERSVLVYVPESYARGGQKYPVVYMLDGHGAFLSLMPGTLDHLTWSGHIPEMILVSLQNTNRTRDLTPTKSPRSPGSGGSDKFLEFIETEVMPLIEQKYRTQPFRIFAGHSLGGLQVVYAFLSRPELFQAYIAGSPVLHWDNNFVIKRAEEVFKQKRAWKKTMFLALGDEPNYKDGFNAFKSLLARVKPDDFDYEFRNMPEENHTSVSGQAYYLGLRKIYAGWLPPTSGSLRDFEGHYKKLSERFGYPIAIPENILNTIGYQLLGANQTNEAIDVFKRNIELYPDSVNVYDSLAEAYERAGQFEAAGKNYEKALSLADKNGNREQGQAIRRNLEWVNSKRKTN